MLAANIGDFVVAAPLSFLVGLLAGWLISSRYRITKVGEPKTRRRRNDA